MALLKKLQCSFTALFSEIPTQPPGPSGFAEARGNKGAWLPVGLRSW